VTAAAQVRKRGVAEVVTAVEQGSLAVSAAAKIAKLPKDRQAPRLERDQRKERGEGKQPGEFYRTPPEATLAVVDVEKFAKTATMVDPACGDGAIARVLESLGYRVISSDLHDRGYGESGQDFLKETVKRGDILIANPPNTLAAKFVLHALDLGYEVIAILAPVTWVVSEERYEELWRLGKLARKWTLHPRPTLWRGDEAGEKTGGMADYAWFIFDQNHAGIGYQGGWARLPKGKP
jgi:hypothetical protein